MFGCVWDQEFGQYLDPGRNDLVGLTSEDVLYKSEYIPYILLASFLDVEVVNVQFRVDVGKRRSS